MKKFRGLIISVVLFVLGLLANIYGNSTAYVDEVGMVHESPLVMVGPLLMFVAVVWLIVWGIGMIVKAVKKSPEAGE